MAVLSQAQQARRPMPGGEGGGPHPEGTPAVHEITLPPEHPLCALRDLWLSTPSSGVPLRLDLLCGQGGDPMRPEEVLAREDAPFVISLTRFATKRIQRLFTGGSPNTGADLNEGIFLYLSGDGMTAWLLFLPPVGNGAPLSAEQLEQALVRRGVIYGVDRHLLEQLPTLSGRYFRLFRIASGAPPVPGENGRVVDCCARPSGDDLPVDDLDQADYETLRLVQDIKQGDVICELFPPPRASPATP